MTENEQAIRVAILAAARKEFFQKGYHDASLRSIAQVAHVTTGSLYWYFKNKEELLDALVGPHYAHALYLYRHFLEQNNMLSVTERLTQMRAAGHACVRELLTYMYAHLEEFKFLISAAAGTKYADFVHQLVTYELDETTQFYHELAQQHVGVSDDFRQIEHVLVSGLFTSVCEMVVHEFPLAQAYRCAEQLIDFYTAGWLYVMGLPLPEEMQCHPRRQ